MFLVDIIGNILKRKEQTKMIQLQKAKRAESKIKIGISGPPGSGKTLSSLLLAFGMVKAAHPELNDSQCWDKVCIIDTENGSASLYANFTIKSASVGEFFVIPMSPPFEAQKFIDSIHAAEQSGIEVIIIDSFSAYWAGIGGALDKQGKIAARSGNSYTAWRDVTPEYNRLVDTILQSSCNVIVDVRAKTEYLQTKDSNGKTVVKNMGMGLQARDTLEYELGVVFLLDTDHVANATKDRTGLFDNRYFTITPETGKEIYRWLSSGAPEAPKEVPAPVKAEPAAAPVTTESAVTMEMVDAVVKARCAGITPEEKKQVVAELKEITGGTANYLSITNPDVLKAIYEHFKGENA